VGGLDQPGPAAFAYRRRPALHPGHRFGAPDGNAFHLEVFLYGLAAVILIGFCCGGPAPQPR